MSFDTVAPAGTGTAGLVEWCRRDRSAGRLVLAAAAGDPVAISHLTADLGRPDTSTNPVPAVEIVAARRPDRLVDLADRWRDANDPQVTHGELAAWRVAFRHLRDRIDLAAALRGPLAAEATIVFPESQVTAGPITWDACCTAAARRPLPPDYVRTIARLGIVEPTLDVEPLAGRPPAVWRVLRGRWGDAPGLARLVAEHDLRNGDPGDLAVWWEAAVAVGHGELLADRAGEEVLTRLLTDDRPDRWWPAVLATLTDWIVP